MGHLRRSTLSPIIILMPRMLEFIEVLRSTWVWIMNVDARKSRGVEVFDRTFLKRSVVN